VDVGFPPIFHTCPFRWMSCTYVFLHGAVGREIIYKIPVGVVSGITL
jgi:hypothetical protein